MSARIRKVHAISPAHVRVEFEDSEELMRVFPDASREALEAGLSLILGQIGYSDREILWSGVDDDLHLVLLFVPTAAEVSKALPPEFRDAVKARLAAAQQTVDQKLQHPNGTETEDDWNEALAIIGMVRQVRRAMERGGADLKMMFALVCYLFDLIDTWEGLGKVAAYGWQRMEDAKAAGAATRKGAAREEIEDYLATLPDDLSATAKYKYAAEHFGVNKSTIQRRLGKKK